jgi:hypothetical protein
MGIFRWFGLFEPKKGITIDEKNNNEGKKRKRNKMKERTRTRP